MQSMVEKGIVDPSAVISGKCKTQSIADKLLPFATRQMKTFPDHDDQIMDFDITDSFLVYSTRVSESQTSIRAGYFCVYSIAVGKTGPFPPGRMGECQWLRAPLANKSAVCPTIRLLVGVHGFWKEGFSIQPRQFQCSHYCSPWCMSGIGFATL